MKDKNYFNKFFLFIIFIFNISCLNVKKDSFPISNVRFSVVKVNTSLTLEFLNHETGKKEIKNLEVFLFGSGIIIKNYFNSFLVLTANHVVNNEKIDLFINKLKMMLFLTGNNKTLENYKAEISIVDYSGKIYKEVKMFSKDETKDLCLLKVFGKKNQQVNFSLTPPEIWEKVYYSGYPKGIQYKNVSFIFNGYYSGDSNLILNNINTKFSFYSDLFVAVGSSGSAILNSNNEIIGIVLRMYKSLDKFVISSTYKDLKSFLKLSGVI